MIDGPRRREVVLSIGVRGVKAPTYWCDLDESVNLALLQAWPHGWAMLAYGELVKLALFCANQARTTAEKEVRSRAWRLALQYREDAAKLGKPPDIGEAPSDLEKA
jgi:hypothetical protein